MADAAVEAWALPRLQRLLPLDDDSLRQILQYTSTLSKDAAAEHLKNLLGDTPAALEFISSYNQRRKTVPQTPKNDTPPQPAAPTRSNAAAAGPKRKFKKPNIHTLPARQVDGHGDVGGAYLKRDEEDYMTARTPRAAAGTSRTTHKERVADNLALRETQPRDAVSMPLITDVTPATSTSTSAKAPPSAAGHLISDALAPRKATSGGGSNRHASPAPVKTKVNIAGGTAMHGASTTLSDLDSAIRSLELQTNPTLSTSATAAEDPRRKCFCMATRHPLLDVAPNCLSCGQIICVKQGLGPCVFCGTPLMSADDIGKVLRVLKDERGEERQKVNNAAYKKADVAHGKARALTGREFLAQTTGLSARSSPLSSAGPSTPAGSDDEASAKAQMHRDKLLQFQANNARRTRIHDEAADYDAAPSGNVNMWASPAERAAQLKKQQRLLREMEWNARPEYEKRRVVASIDLKGGKVVRRMAEVERPTFEDNADLADDEMNAAQDTNFTSNGGLGAFSKNPLASGMIRPRAREEKGKAVSSNQDTPRAQTAWRRVQMDEDDNEAWILDGGVYGGRAQAQSLETGDEPGRD